MAHVVTVGIDGTLESSAAAVWAAQEAVIRDSSLQVVHVRIGDSALDPALVHADTAVRHAEQVLREATGMLADRFPALSLEGKTPVGDPAQVLTEFSRTSELLVVGSRGLTPLGGFLVGSVALPSVAHAHCPVVLVRADGGNADERAKSETEAGRQEGEPRSTVVGVDIRHPCEELLDFAFEVARRHSTELKILHGWDPPPYYGSRPFPLAGLAIEDLLAERAATLAETVQPWRDKYPGVTVDARAVGERPASLLAYAAEEAGLLVVGRRRRTHGFGSHVGPVAHAAMHHARVPVAIVPHA